MKRYVFKLFLFLLCFFFLAFLIQRLFFAGIKKISVGDYGVFNSIETGSINTEMLISGSSRGYYHYNPEILKDVTGLTCYNISTNGSDLGVQLPILRWYMDKNRPPRYLIQNIDVFIGEIDPTIYEPFKFLPYLNNYSLYGGLLRLDKRWWFHKYVPITNLVYYGKDFHIKFSEELFQSLYKKPDTLIMGYFPRNSQWPNDQYEADYLKKNARGFRYTLSQAYRQYLNELAGLCQEHSIQLVLVISPEYDKFITLQINRREIVEYYMRLSDANGLWFFDFSESALCKNRKYFYNFTHLNSEGADLFSRELAAKLKNRIMGN